MHLHSCAFSHRRTSPWTADAYRGDEYRLQKLWSELVSWAREELSLRPLPCQLQRATTGLLLARPPWLLRQQVAARLLPPKRGHPDLRDHNLNRPSHHPDCLS